MKKLLTGLNRFKNFLILMGLLGLGGYTARQISQIVNVTPDPTYVEQRRQAASAGLVKIDTKTIEGVGGLTPINGSSGVVPTVKPDPFSQ